MGFIYYWLVTDMPIKRESKCTLEVERKLKKGLGEILEKYNVKMNKNKYIEQCIGLFRQRAKIGEFPYVIGKSEHPTIKDRKRQYIWEAHNPNNKKKYNNSYAEIIRKHKDKLYFGYFTPPNNAITEEVLGEIETLYILVFDAINDEVGFNKLSKGKSNRLDIPEKHKEEICQIYQECQSKRETHKRFNKMHQATSYTLYRISTILYRKGIDTSINYKFPPKPILMCEIKTGKVVKNWDSKGQAAKYIANSGISNNSVNSIQNCISDAIKRQGTAYGFRWREDIGEDDENIIF